MLNLELLSENIKKKYNISPEIGIILGSGLGSFADKIEKPIIINYSDIENFPKSTVKGHKGQFIIGELEGKKIIAMNGRFHYYEGYPIEQVVLPVQLMCQLGIEKLIVTNAAGGVDKSFEPGDIMIITDHINFSGINPLIGPNDDHLGPRFPDMSEAYSSKYIQVLREISDDLNLGLKDGAYMYFTGPNYETPKEVEMARVLGASSVGMSTVPEVILANHRGVEVIGLSCITNMAAGILKERLNHEDVVRTSNLVKDKFSILLEELLRRI